MNLLSQWSLRTRFRIVIATVTASLLALGAWGVVANQAGIQKVEGLFNSANAGTAEVGQLRRSISELRRLEANAIAVGSSNSVELQRLREAWVAEGRAIKATGDQLQASHKEDAVIVDQASQLGGQVDAYSAVIAPVLAQLEGAQIDGPVALAYAGQAEPLVKALLDTSEALLVAQRQSLDQTRADMAASATFVSNLRLVLVGATLAIFLPLMTLTLRSVCGPLEQAVAVARRIAGGDLRALPPVQGVDETAQLMRALGEMQAGLRQLVGQVRESAESIQVASSEVASGNMDLSQRTEQAAGNLQQTAGAMQQLTGTVAQSADAAREADGLARGAADVAGRGGAVVSQVVATMDAISGSSKKIGDIIGVIDGIAFQTNILALNAAVEAARAGEQGRGFAVVAGEVRALARRSADAAHEIKDLIGDSVDKVQAGSRLVGDAGQTMQEIVASVQRVSGIIGQISLASGEQNSGIGQIHGSVAQLDQMTQQNAALVEQSAAAAESLKAQAQTLTRLVATFQLDDAETA